MTRPDGAAVLELFRAADSFLIVSHQNPDGDAIGSILAVYHLLRGMGKERIACACEDPVPAIYHWLSGAERIGHTPEITTPDVVVMVDVSQKSRVGKIADAIPASAKVVVIDHHLESPEGDYILADPSYSAAGEIVAELFDQAGVPISREAAECVYVAILTDTGGFRFSNTSPRCLHLAASLVEKGIDVSDVSSRVFDTMALPKFELLRRMLQNVKRVLDGRVAYSILTVRDAAEAQAHAEDYDGLVNFTRNIEGVEVGILFRETDNQTTKVSLRSRGQFNCAQFLKQFGGGGHAAAAGATVQMPIDATCKTVLDRIQDFPPFLTDNKES